MLVGYNTNISYKGIVYHVQTEDSGIKNPMLVTLLYYKGAILSSKKTSYADIVGDPNMRTKLEEIMKDQHKKMIKELIAGKYTGEAAEEKEKLDVHESTHLEIPVEVPKPSAYEGGKLKIETNAIETSEEDSKSEVPQNAAVSRRIRFDIDGLVEEFLAKEKVQR